MLPSIGGSRDNTIILAGIGIAAVAIFFINKPQGAGSGYMFGPNSNLGQGFNYNQYQNNQPAASYMDPSPRYPGTLR